MKRSLIAVLISFLSLTAQAHEVSCQDEGIRIASSGDRFEATISDPSFVKTVQEKLLGGQVYFYCAGYCVQQEGWTFRGKNNLISNVSIEKDEAGKDVVKIKDLRYIPVKTTDHLGRVIIGQYSGREQFSSRVSERENGDLDVYLIDHEMTGSHTSVTYEVQHWYFKNCK